MLRAFDKTVLSLVVCGCLAPAAALMPPDLAYRRTQLVQLLPYQQVVELQAWVPQQSVLLSPQQYMELLRGRFPYNSVAWTYYAGWSYLDLLEQTQQAYDERDDVLERGQALLEQYESRANDVLRLSIDPGKPRALTIQEPKSQPDLQENDEFLRVFRPLPWPENGYDREQVLQLLEACRQDLVRVQEQRRKIESARAAFVDHQELWAGWLTELVQASQKFTQAEYLKPYDDPLPMPPAEAPTGMP